MNPRESKVAVVTGGTQGIGAAVARELAARSVSLVIIARDASRGVPFCEQLRREGAPDALFVKADLSLMSDVRQAARTTRERHARIDVLVNNAAGMFPKRTLTSEGIEKTLALDYLAPMELTEGLLACLEVTPNARVVNLVSKAALRGRLALDDLGMTRGYSGLAAYARAKLALMIGTVDLAERHPALHVNCIHPGMVNTGMPQELPSYFRIFVRVFGRFLTTAEGGAARVLRLAVGEPGGAITGAYFDRQREVALPAAARDPAIREKLRDVTRELLSRLDRT